MVAPPEQGEREHERAAVEQDEGAAQPGSAAADPGLRQVDQVETTKPSKANNRFQLLARRGLVAAAADAEQQQVGGTEDEADAPDQFALVRQAGLAQQIDGAHRVRRFALDLARLGFVGEQAIGLEVVRVLVPVCRSRSLRWPCWSTRKRSLPWRSRWPRKAVVTDSSWSRWARMKTLRASAWSALSRSTKKTRLPSLDAWKMPGPRARGPNAGHSGRAGPGCSR